MRCSSARSERDTRSCSACARVLARWCRGRRCSRRRFCLEQCARGGQDESPQHIQRLVHQDVVVRPGKDGYDALIREDKNELPTATTGAIRRDGCLPRLKGSQPPLVAVAVRLHPRGDLGWLDVVLRGGVDPFPADDLLPPTSRRDPPELWPSSNLRFRAAQRGCVRRTCPLLSRKRFAGSGPRGGGDQQDQWKEPREDRDERQNVSHGSRHSHCELYHIGCKGRTRKGASPN